MASTGKSISDLIRSLFIAAAVAGLAVCLCVSAAIVAVDTKLSTNARISEINESVNLSLQTLVESYRFKETTAVSYIIERLRDRTKTIALQLDENFKDDCAVETYLLGEFKVCWRAKSVSVARQISGTTFLVYEIQPQYLVGPLYQQGFMVLLVMIVVIYLMLFLAFRSIWKRILEPIQEFHRTLSDHSGSDFKVTSELEEMKTLGRAVLQLRQATQNEAVVRTIAMVFHDVMKPFAVLKGSLKTLGETKSFDDFKAEYPKIEAQVARVTRKAQVLMQEISDYSSELNLDLKPWSLESVVREALSEVSDFFDRASVSIRLDWGHKNLALCDTFRLQRVISNMVINACQASRLTGAVWITTKQVNKRIFVVVGNSGSHVPEASILKLFEYRFTEGKSRGTGLGLAIAKHIIHAHGGEISVASTAEKNQVEFEFDVAASELNDQIKTPHEGDLKDFGTRFSLAEKGSSHQNVTVELEHRSEDIFAARVLIIEDEISDRDHIKRSFEKSEYRDYFVLKECLNPDVIGVDLVSEFDVFIVDIDLGLEDKNGLDIVQNIRKIRGSEVLIFVCSNQSMADDMTKAMSSGATAFIPKPFSFLEFLKHYSKK